MVLQPGPRQRPRIAASSGSRHNAPGFAGGYLLDGALPELDTAGPDGVPWLTPEERDQEQHLLYVAATRARHRLEPNGAVGSCLAAPPGPAAADRKQAA